MSITHEDGVGGHIAILEAGSETAPMRYRMVMPKGGGPARAREAPVDA